jgi:hypothetical protein
VTTVLASATVAVLRGTTTDAYGDPVDADTAIRARIPIALAVTNRRVWVPAEQRHTRVSEITGRVGWNVDIREEDRLRDTKSGSIYLVEAVTRPPRVTGMEDVRLTLRRVDD